MILKQLNDNPQFAILCPACDDIHVIEPEAEWDGNQQQPSFRHSIYDADSQGVCHFAIQKGKIFYHPDCTHHLSEQSVPLPPLPAWLTDEPEEKPKKTRHQHGYFYTDPLENAPTEADWHRSSPETGETNPDVLANGYYEPESEESDELDESIPMEKIWAVLDFD